MSRTKKTPSLPVLQKDFHPKTQNQNEYVRAMAESDLTFCTGPGGAGKTACVVGLAVQYLIEGKTDRLVFTRPTVEASSTFSHNLGALPGGIQEKLDPYLKPIYYELEKYLGQRLDMLIYEEKIVFAPFEYMRGDTFDCFVVLDEAQNATYRQLKMFTTRLGEHGKMVINGDSEQTDLPDYLAGGLDIFMDELEDIDGIAVCELDESDIQRHGLVGKISARLRDYELNRAKHG